MFDKNGLATKTFKTNVYAYNAEKEFSVSLYIQIEEGTGIPAQTTLIKPNERKEGFTQVFNETDQEWEYVEDHRGKTAYNTNTHQPIDVDFIGDLPDTLTFLAPKTEFDKWNGKKWVVDEKAVKGAQVESAQNKKIQLSQEAENRITQLERKIRLSMASDEEAELLKSWEIYTVNLDDVNPELAPNIEWPQKPE